ncbi:MAG: glycosyltransferase [Bacteroidota bacterium]|nr:glycosyltransferase [Bacteroidota bacterium]
MTHRHLKVLVAPLDWGLGHATRCIPVIRELLRQEAKVIISASGNGYYLLKNIFPLCEFINIPGITIRYPESSYMAFSMMSQLPAILKAIRKETELLKSVIEPSGITHVISDNRYGLYDNRIKCAFISHQVSIKSFGLLKLMEPWLYQLHKKRIEKFHELWIPDVEGPGNLAGSLTEAPGLTIPKKYIGFLSRFNESIQRAQKKYDYISVLSGPEPQRSLLENKIKAYFLSSEKKCLIVQGIPATPLRSVSKNVEIVNVISDADLQELLHPDTTLFCRPGYSTLMDLAILGHKKIVFIPTPGQTEQEYLAAQLEKNYDYNITRQKDSFPQNVSSGKALPNHFQQNRLMETMRDFLKN